MGVRYRGQAVFKLGLARPACQIKFASDQGNQITTGKVNEEVPLFEQSGDWVLRSILGSEMMGYFRHTKLQ